MRVHSCSCIRQNVERNLDQKFVDNYELQYHNTDHFNNCMRDILYGASRYSILQMKIWSMMRPRTSRRSVGWPPSTRPDELVRHRVWPAIREIFKGGPCSAVDVIRLIYNYSEPSQNSSQKQFPINNNRKILKKEIIDHTFNLFIT